MAIQLQNCLPSPTTPPTPTVAPLDGSVSIRNSSWYVDIIGAIWVVGEVLNGLDHSAALVEVSVDLYSASNTLIDTGNGIACVITMASGSDSPFTVLVIGPPPDVDHVVVQVTDFLEPPFFIIDPPIVDLDAAITLEKQAIELSPKPAPAALKQALQRFESAKKQD